MGGEYFEMTEYIPRLGIFRGSSELKGMGMECGRKEGRR
jgi:hypothetical protein